MNKSRACVWCGEKGGELQRVSYAVKGKWGRRVQKVELSVHSRHRSNLDDYIDRYNRYARFYVCSVVGLTAALIGLYLLNAWIEIPVRPAGGLIVSAMGLLIAVFPFATPTTTGSFGVRSSRRLVRVLGTIVTVGSFVTLVL